MLKYLHKEHCRHLLRPILGNPSRVTFEEFVDGSKPKVEPEAEMFGGYGVVHLIVDFLMGGYGVSEIFSFQEKLGFPKIGQQYKMGFPIGNDSVKDGPEHFVFSYFPVKGFYQKFDVGSIGDILLFHSLR